MDLDPNKIHDIPMDKIFIDENLNLGRGVINPMDVIDLSKDIAEKGLHTPVFVQPWDKIPGKDFRLVAGYRRFKAHCLIRDNPEYRAKVGDKADTIRALLKFDLSDDDAKILNLSENIHRQNLNMKQEARAIESFKRSGWTEPDTAKKLNMSRGWVQVRFMLLDLPDDIQDEAAAGMITQQQIRHAYALRDSDEALYGYIKALKDKKLLGKKRDIDPNKITKKNEKRVRNETEIFALQDTIRETFDGNNLATRVLGWAAGVVSDKEVHESIWDFASRAGKFYMIPQGLEGDRVKVVEEPKPQPIVSLD